MIDIGEKIRLAWERKIGRKITCTTCLEYLRELGSTIPDDHAQFVIELKKHLPFPVSVSKRLSWLESQQLIVDTICPVIKEAGLQFSNFKYLKPVKRQARRLVSELPASHVNHWNDVVAKNDRPRVGWLSTAFMQLGGTETFHRTLIPRLKATINVIGFVATGQTGGDGKTLKVRYATGVNSARDLAFASDVLVTWGISDLRSLLPANRPRVIAVHHSDESSDWSNHCIANQLDLIDSVVCVNKEVFERLSHLGRPVHYIPNAVDPKRIIPSGRQSELRTQFGIPSDTKIVLFGHRLSAEKRPDLAVEIGKRLPDGWTMVIAGDGPEMLQVQRSAAGTHNVRVIGLCDNLADWLSISDCFLSLSTFEGFGLSIAEAMTAGVPTVSTPTGIAPGLAITLPINSDADAWANAIVNSSNWQQPDGIQEMFNVQTMVDSWSRLIGSYSRTVL